jgi:succinate-acetate transporter protein
VTANRVAATAAVCAAASWAVKAIAIWIAGGLNKTPLEDILFWLGFMAMVVAFVALGVAAARGRSVLVKVVAGVVGLVVGVVALVAVEDGVGAVVPESAGWVAEEVGLWIAAAATTAIALLWLRSRESVR